jgi:hypothetical protein
VDFPIFLDNTPPVQGPATSPGLRNSKKYPKFGWGHGNCQNAAREVSIKPLVWNFFGVADREAEFTPQKGGISLVQERKAENEECP